MIISIAHRAARNAASIALADAGPAASAIWLYASEGGVIIGKRTLAKPCGVITDQGRIQLMPAATADLVVATGIPTWAAWCDGHGAVVAAGAVTGDDGDGPFKLSGTGPDGALYAGGIVQLVSPALLG